MPRRLNQNEIPAPQFQQLAQQLAQVSEAIVSNSTTIDEIMRRNETLETDNLALRGRLQLAEDRHHDAVQELTVLRLRLDHYAPKELADERVKEELAKLQQMYEKLVVGYNALYKLADWHCDVRTCKNCEKPYARGYVCIHCGHDNSYDPSEVA